MLNNFVEVPKIICKVYYKRMGSVEEMEKQLEALKNQINEKKINELFEEKTKTAKETFEAEMKEYEKELAEEKAKYKLNKKTNTYTITEEELETLIWYMYEEPELKVINKEELKIIPKNKTGIVRVQNTNNPNEIYEGKTPVCLCRVGKSYCGVEGDFLCEKHKKEYKVNKKLKVGFWGCFGENTYGVGNWGAGHNAYMARIPVQIAKQERETADFRPEECKKQYPLE